MQKSCFILRHVMQKRYVVRHGGCDTSDWCFDKEHFETNQNGPNIEPIGSKIMVQTVVFMLLMTLTLTFTLTFDLCSIFLSHAFGRMYWHPHAFHKKFHKNPSSING